MIKKITSIALCAMLLCSNVSYADSVVGAWVTTAYGLDYPKTSYPKKEYCKLLDQMQQKGVNTIVFQVRGAGDAFYNSDIVYKSIYAKDFSGDILKFLIDETHKRDMEFHAWFNPYRVTVDSYDDQLSSFNRDWLVKYKGNYFLDPGKPEVRKYLRNVIYEVISKYDVDAIHFDDYFYPGKDFDDADTYKKYGNSQNLGEWRRSNVNTLVYNISKLTHKKGVKFGISPSGIWRNKDSDPKGSDSRGFSSYDDIYADSLYWVEHEYIDYIAPQIYWEIGNPNADYSKVLDWWSKAVEDYDVDLFVGLGIYNKWPLTQTQQQIEMANEKADGYIYFSATQVKDLPNVMTNIMSSLDSELEFFSYKE